MILIADPQIIDAHSYPSRPWPLSALTVLITDNFLRRSYSALQRQLRPDSLFFLGDLFDGGREWKTSRGSFVDPQWGIARPAGEQEWVETWHRSYGEDYWLREFQRFGSIFFDNWSLGGDSPAPWQRGRKLVASLPGNHDIGFGAQIQVPVRNRFSAFFGDANRVDIIGNHTIVSVDTVSLSADTSTSRDDGDLRPIYRPVQDFLEEVQSIKRRAVRDELGLWHNLNLDRLPQKLHLPNDADLDRQTRDPGPGAPQFPTILLTHVPLFREPGTPCGPLRERWPPSKASRGQAEASPMDIRNAIPIAAGYQYQNVLSEDDSIKLVASVGNVSHVFSGDDHDYCEVVHSSAKSGAREITVKSFSMAMGISTPGFLMVSLYNPVEADGRPMAGSPEVTLQTHLCLLPNQVRTYVKYVTLIVGSVLLLALRAFLVPVLHLTPFSLDPEPGPSVLPTTKDKAKAEPPDYAVHKSGAATSGIGSPTGARNGRAGRWSPHKGPRGRRWGWGDAGAGPRIKLDDDFYDGGREWRTTRGRPVLAAWGRELWTTTWRVVWMTALFWLYLTGTG